MRIGDRGAGFLVLSLGRLYPIPNRGGEEALTAAPAVGLTARRRGQVAVVVVVVVVVVGSCTNRHCGPRLQPSRRWK